MPRLQREHITSPACLLLRFPHAVPENAYAQLGATQLVQLGSTNRLPPVAAIPLVVQQGANIPAAAMAAPYLQQPQPQLQPLQQHLQLQHVPQQQQQLLSLQQQQLALAQPYMIGAGSVAAQPLREWLRRHIPVGCNSAVVTCSCFCTGSS